MTRQFCRPYHTPVPPGIAIAYNTGIPRCLQVPEPQAGMLMGFVLAQNVVIQSGFFDTLYLMDENHMAQQITYLSRRYPWLVFPSERSSTLPRISGKGARWIPQRLIIYLPAVTHEVVMESAKCKWVCKVPGNYMQAEDRTQFDHKSFFRLV